MLYDNAQLLELLALAHAHRPHPLYAGRPDETVGRMIRDMTARRVDGLAAFAASEDADSEGNEGRFYVWAAEQVDALLGPDATAFKLCYDVVPGGNWDGHVILRRAASRGFVGGSGLRRRRRPPGIPAGTHTAGRGIGVTRSGGRGLAGATGTRAACRPSNLREGSGARWPGGR